MRVLIIGTHTRVFLAPTSSLGLEGGSKSYSEQSIGFKAIGIYTNNAVIDNTWILLGLFELRLRIRTCVLVELLQIFRHTYSQPGQKGDLLRFVKTGRRQPRTLGDEEMIQVPVGEYVGLTFRKPISNDQVQSYTAWSAQA